MPRLKPASRLLSCQISQAAAERPVVTAEREAVDAEALADRVDDDARVVDVDRHPQAERLDDPADLVRLAVPALVVRLVEGHAGRVDEAPIDAHIVAPAGAGERRPAGPLGQAAAEPVEPPGRAADVGGHRAHRKLPYTRGFGGGGGSSIAIAIARTIATAAVLGRVESCLDAGDLHAPVGQDRGRVRDVRGEDRVGLVDEAPGGDELVREGRGRAHDRRGHRHLDHVQPVVPEHLGRLAERLAVEREGGPGQRPLRPLVARLRRRVARRAARAGGRASLRCWPSRSPTRARTPAPSPRPDRPGAARPRSRRARRQGCGRCRPRSAGVR